MIRFILSMKGDNCRQNRNSKLEHHNSLDKILSDNEVIEQSTLNNVPFPIPQIQSKPSYVTREIIRQRYNDYILIYYPPWRCAFATNVWDPFTVCITNRRPAQSLLEHIIVSPPMLLIKPFDFLSFLVTGADDWLQEVTIKHSSIRRKVACIKYLKDKISKIQWCCICTTVNRRYDKRCYMCNTLPLSTTLNDNNKQVQQWRKEIERVSFIENNTESQMIEKIYKRYLSVLFKLWNIVQQTPMDVMKVIVSYMGMYCPILRIEKNQILNLTSDMQQNYLAIILEENSTLFANLKQENRVKRDDKKTTCCVSTNMIFMSNNSSIGSDNIIKSIHVIMGNYARIYSPKIDCAYLSGDSKAIKMVKTNKTTTKIFFENVNHNKDSRKCTCYYSTVPIAK
eukprot:252465_1